jgi:hypothetical protein
MFAMLVGLFFGWIPFNPVEIEILKELPQPLLYISQTPGAPMAISFSNRVSPTVLCIFTFIVSAMGAIIRKYRANKANKVD